VNARTAVSWIGTLGGAATAAFMYGTFRREMGRAAKRISGSKLITTSHGPIEYSSVGDGFPLLLIHGAGGGFDQMQAFESNGLSDMGFRLIFVSRFGYVQTPLPSDSSAKAQAVAYAALLDALGVEQAGVIAISAGAPSALHFAANYPHRCAALALLVPAAYLPGSEVTSPPVSALVELLRDELLKSDFAFWLAVKLARETMIEKILGVPRDVARRATPIEKRRLNGVLANILPVSKRRAGLLNDGQVLNPLEPVNMSRIKMPTLLISAEDCLYGTARCVRCLAQQIPDARVVIYPDGGHLWIGHDAEFQRELMEFLRPLAARELVGTAVTASRT